MDFWITPQTWESLQLEHTTAHAIYSSGLIKIERYADEILISRYSQDESVQSLLDELVNWCKTVSFNPSKIYLKNLVKNPTANSLPELLKGTPGNSEIMAQEQTLSFHVDLMGGYSTGLFIDQRLNRKSLMSLKPKHVLNCFAYTCAFSIAAASVGASTTNIDLASKSLERGKKNFELNHLTLDGHYFIADDVRSVLPRLHRKGLQFDAIILDPPTFARSKKGPPFKVEKEYPQLIDMALDCATKNAAILLSTNSRDLTPDNLKSMGQEIIQSRGLKGHFEDGLRPPDISELDMPSTVWLRLA